MSGLMVVVRCWPDPAFAAALPQHLAVPGARLFLHGDGVVLAELDRLPALASAADLEVCATSWQRRHADLPESRFRLASLASMYQALDAGTDYIACGTGGVSAWRRRRGPLPAWLFEIASSPRSERDRRETLEFVLGAAALGLDGRVLFRGPGYNHLLTEAARGWAQLSDFDLLELVCEVPEAVELRVSAKRVDAAAADRCAAADARRLLL